MKCRFYYDPILGLVYWEFPKKYYKTKKKNESNR